MHILKTILNIMIPHIEFCLNSITKENNSIRPAVILSITEHITDGSSQQIGGSCYLHGSVDDNSLPCRLDPVCRPCLAYSVRQS